MRAALPAVLLLLAMALAGCGSGGGGKDGDGDGLHDSIEKAGWPILVDHLDERVGPTVRSDPGKADTDGDGIPDGEEYQFQTDPTQADTDGDGLSDCQEVRHKARAQCEDEAFHGPFDGGYGTDPTSADSDPGVSRYVLERPFTDHTGTLPDGYPSTGDGISDGDELAGYTIQLANGNSRVVRTDPRNADSDGDALDDGEERFQYSSDPVVADTDGDGCEDGVDPIPARAEGYRAGLGNFTLLRDGGAEVRFVVSLANVASAAPASGYLAVESGHPTDLSAQSPGPLRPEAGQCRIVARHPWTLFQVAVETRQEALDLGSAAGTGAVAMVWWNIRDGTLSRSDGGAPLPGSVYVSEGRDGRIELRPSAEFP